MIQISEIAYAKVNIALHVRKRRNDGYHILETIFAFVDDGDRLFYKAADELKLKIIGPYGDGLSNSDNLVLDAAIALQKKSGCTKGADITLDKRLPIASGIGGGSADAAAALRLLNQQWDLGLSLDQLAEIAKPLGADIPACIYSHVLRGDGIGDELQDIDDSGLIGKNILLINPNKPVSTAEIFMGWDMIDHGPLGNDDILTNALNGRNDLQKPAIEICPEIEGLLNAMKANNPIMSRMSGSGATCFALYGDTKSCKMAVSNLQSLYPDYWFMAGKIR